MKIEEFKKLIREEIQNAIKEMVAPTDFLQKKFPEIVEYDREKKMSDLYWTVITIKQWNIERASDFQEAIGYSPMGYGGPYQFEEEKLPDNKFKYTWYCGATS